MIFCSVPISNMHSNRFEVSSHNPLLAKVTNMQQIIFKADLVLP